MKDLKHLYEQALTRFEVTNMKLQQKIDTYLKLEANGNVGIRFHEMSAEQIVNKLKTVEMDSKVIWKAFDQNYGYGFFFDVLEVEFGITPETRDNLIDRFNQEINKFKTVANTQISSITEKTHGELDRLRIDCEDKTLEISMLKQKHLIDIDRVKDNIAGAMELKMQGQMTKQFRIFDDEKADFYAQIKELEAAAGNYKQIKLDYQKEIFFTKWMFISKIRSIRSLADMNQRAESAGTLEKQIADRDLKLFLHKNPHLDLKSELQDAKAEIVQLCQSIGDI